MIFNSPSKILVQAIPIKDFTYEGDDEVQGPESEGLLGDLEKRLTIVRGANFFRGIEDVVFEIYKRIFRLLETEKDSEQRHALSLQFVMEINAPFCVSPELRKHLISLCLDTLLQNQWTFHFALPIIRTLFGLLNGSPGPDLALSALRDVWRRFKVFYNDLKEGKLITLFQTVQLSSGVSVLKYIKQSRPGPVRISRSMKKCAKRFY